MLIFAFCIRGAAVQSSQQNPTCLSRHPVQRQQQISIQFNVRSEETYHKIVGANMADKTEIGEVEGFLIQNNLSSYIEAFINAGCDDMQQIKNIVASDDKAETEMFLQDVGLHLKPGHKRRFIAGVQVLASKERTSNQNSFEKTSKRTAGKTTTREYFCITAMVYVLEMSLRILGTLLALCDCNKTLEGYRC